MKTVQFSVGNPVRTTESWEIRWIGPASTGTVEKIDLNGSPRNKDRTVLVKLDKPIGPFSKVWFNPDDLEMDV